MNERLDFLLKRYEELSQLAQDPDLTKNTNRYRDVMKEYSQLGEIVTAHDEVTDLSEQIENAKSIVQNEKLCKKLY